MAGDDQGPRTLYVGNLSPHVTEELLIALFCQIGECKSCKIIHDNINNSDPYAFVEFAEPQAAAAALAAMNKRMCLGKEMKVNWASTSGHPAKSLDNNNMRKFYNAEHYHIFVGDLAPEVEQQTLREAFQNYGELSDVKIMKDPHTQAHKGYGFVSFVNKVDAESAIASMNGQWLGSRKIRTNWATRKVQPGNNDMMMGGGMGGGNMAPKYTHKLDYNEVWNRTSDSNTTVYCGGINNFTEDLVRQTFGLYGNVIAVHAFPDRGYAFIRFSTKESACQAICGVHGLEINGGQAKCSWGKENIDMNNTQSGLGGGIGGGMNNNLQQQNIMSSMQQMSAMGLYGNNNSNGNVAALAAQNGGQNPLQANAAALAGLGGTNGNGVGSNAWNTAQQANQNNQQSNWAAATNFPQWAAAAGYPQNAAAMNAAMAANAAYWPSGYSGYQNPMMQQQQPQGWGVMPNAGATGANNGNGGAGQYQMGQYQQGANGKS